MPVWTNPPPVATTLADADELNGFMDNIKQLVGRAAGQTYTERDARLQVAEYYEGNVTPWGLVHQFVSASGSGGEIALLSQNIESPSTIPSGAVVDYEGYVGEVDGATQEQLGRLRWTKVGESGDPAAPDGSFEIAPYVSGAVVGSSTAPPFYINRSGQFAIGTKTIPVGVALKVSGSINASSGFKRNGSAMGLWLESVSGTLDYSHSARTGGRLVSTALSPTAPLSASGTALCSGINAEYLDGIGWTPPVAGGDLGGTTIGGSDTILASKTVTAAGRWEIKALAELNCDAGDTGQLFTVKVKQGATVLESDNVKMQNKEDIRGVMLQTSYLSPSGVEQIDITAVKAGGSGSSVGYGGLLMRLRGSS